MMTDLHETTSQKKVTYHVLVSTWKGVEDFDNEEIQTNTTMKFPLPFVMMAALKSGDMKCYKNRDL